MERTMVFIDGNNFYNAAKHFLKQKPKFDIIKMVDTICKKSTGNTYLLRTYFYTVNTPEQQGLVSALKAAPRFTVNNKGYLQKIPIDTEIIESDKSTFVTTEKGTDINLVTDLLKGAYMNSYDKAIIVSADGDYIGPINEIKNIGKIVEIVITKRQPVNKELRDTVDNIIELEEDDFEKVWRGTYISARRSHTAT
ncbi:hypothetical protein CX649_07140 [Bacillaceae bacterium ZC4]|jgi:Uncharacterized conserved protein|uniref:NYN domain-containing protein n=1 Tax=Aeribacillus composti TaxID=1868734 RepID=UPI00118B40F8|nr:hypothetical protein CX649_07140 [Bacillaceae bacterium ZC4]MED1442745.1 NYN domain-containing protein [Aeribacillus composti]BBU38812.1 hypothetical protein APP_11040 [Aeribacillus pallidus]